MALKWEILKECLQEDYHETCVQGFLQCARFTTIHGVNSVSLTSELEL